MPNVDFKLWYASDLLRCCRMMMLVSLGTMTVKKQTMTQKTLRSRARSDKVQAVAFIAVEQVLSS